MPRPAAKQMGPGVLVQQQRNFCSADSLLLAFGVNTGAPVLAGEGQLVCSRLFTPLRVGNKLIIRGQINFHAPAVVDPWGMGIFLAGNAQMLRGSVGGPQRLGGGSSELCQMVCEAEWTALSLSQLSFELRCGPDSIQSTERTNADENGNQLWTNGQVSTYLEVLEYAS